MITEDGESYVAFRKHAGVAVALGDPVGPPGSAASTVNDFVDLCDKAGLVPYIFSCSRATADVTDALGWQSVQVAEDNLIDLPTLEFKGKKWQDIRTALNKAPKEGITFRMVTLANEPWALVRQASPSAASRRRSTRTSRWVLPWVPTARCTASRHGCRCTAVTIRSSAGHWISCAGRTAASGRRWNS